MLYYFTDGYSEMSYHFVYNDEDRSVRYVKSPMDSIPFGSLKIMSKCNNISKLRLLGFYFDQFFNGYTCKLCSYRVSELINITLMLAVDRHENCLMIAKFHLDDSIYRIVMTQVSYGFYEQSFYKLVIKIPYEMIDYMLNLKSIGDFSGIMDSFDRLLGVDLEKVVSNVSVKNIGLIQWF